MRHIQKRCRLEHARIVEQHVDATETRNSSTYNALNRLWSPDVTCYVNDVFAGGVYAQCSLCQHSLPTTVEHDRPGAIERALDGLTPKVQTYYVRRMVALGILDRVVYPEIPPRVEYHLTEFGQHFLPILDAIANLQRELANNASS